MDEMDFDRTRKAIQAQNLDKKSRREMYEKLTAAGGEVQRERALRQDGDASAGKGSMSRAYPESGAKLPSELARERMRAEGEQRARLHRQLIEEEKRAGGFIARFIIKLKCRLNGLTPYGSSEVSPQFLSKLNLNLKRALMECHILGNELFSLDASMANKILRELDAKHPLYAELIGRAARMYDPEELSQLLDTYSPNDPLPISLDFMRRPLFSLTRKIYFLKIFQETYILAVDEALRVQQAIEKKQPALYLTKKKQITLYWRELMNDIYPSLILLVQRSLMKAVEPGSALFEDLMDIDEEEKLGGRKRGESVGIAAGDAAEEDTEAEAGVDADTAADTGAGGGDADDAEGSTLADASSPDSINEEFIQPGEELVDERSSEIRDDPGMQLMYALNVEDLRLKHDPGRAFVELANKDKVFISYLLFMEFEAEYAFILTTQKVKLVPTYFGGRKKDFRQALTDVYHDSRRCSDAFRLYAEQTRALRKALSESGYVNNYVEYAKRIQILEGKCGAIGRESRLLFKEFMGEIAQALDLLLQNIEAGGQAVENHDQPLRFDRLDGVRRMNGKTVRYAMEEAGNYSRALAQRIENGDLFGGVIEMSDEEFARAFKPTEKFVSSVMPDELLNEPLMKDPMSGPEGDSQLREVDPSSGKN